MKKHLENILILTGTIFFLVYFAACFFIWAAGYDSLYQFFNTI